MSNMRERELMEKSKEELEKIKLISEIRQNQVLPIFRPGFIGIMTVLVTLTIGLFQVRKVYDEQLKGQIKEKEEKIEVLKAIQNDRSLQEKQLQVATVNKEIATVQQQIENIESEKSRLQARSEFERKRLEAETMALNLKYARLTKENQDLVLNNAMLAEQKKNIDSEILKLEKNGHVLKVRNSELLEAIESKNEELSKNRVVNLLQLELKSEIIKIYNYQTSTKFDKDPEELRITIEAELNQVYVELNTLLADFEQDTFGQYEKLKKRIEIWLSDSKSIKRVRPFFNFKRIKRIIQDIDELTERIESSK